MLLTEIVFLSKQGKGKGIVLSRYFRFDLTNAAIILTDRQFFRLLGFWRN